MIQIGTFLYGLNVSSIDQKVPKNVFTLVNPSILYIIFL